jgi:hypothetical protein
MRLMVGRLLRMSGLEIPVHQLVNPAILVLVS